jgi:hypothetical protein
LSRKRPLTDREIAKLCEAMGHDLAVANDQLRQWRELASALASAIGLNQQEARLAVVGAHSLAAAAELPNPALSTSLVQAGLFGDLLKNMLGAVIKEREATMASGIKGSGNRAKTATQLRSKGEKKFRTLSPDGLKKYQEKLARRAARKLKKNKKGKGK